jgi:hypothetical protein
MLLTLPRRVENLSRAIEGRLAHLSQGKPMSRLGRSQSNALFNIALTAALLASATQLCAREKNSGMHYGMGLMVNLPFPENEVEQVVRDVAQDGVIQGSKEYNKDPYIAGATAASSTPVFPAWTSSGKVFYKVREHALDPRNFKDSSDVGTLAVRYVLQPQGDKNTALQINAVFVEDFRHSAHLSNGSVESAEYKDIHDRLDAIATMKKQAAEIEREHQLRRAQETTSAKANDPSGSSSSLPQASAGTPQTVAMTAAPTLDRGAAPQTLAEKVKYLRQQVERRVKAPGAPLKSAPFHTAGTLRLLEAGTEVLIVIQTPYWLGVEMHDGQHGWILADDLEFLQ